MLRLLLRLWWLQQRRNFHKRDAFVAGYKEFYKNAKFTHYVDKAIDLKQVVNTNKCLVHVDKYGDKLLITSCIDNLLKGAHPVYKLTCKEVSYGIEDREKTGNSTIVIVGPVELWCDKVFPCQ